MSVMLSASPMSLMRGMEHFILTGTLKSVSSVKWEKDANPHTTGSQIVLPVPQIGMSEIDLALWRYKCQHEIGHESECNSSPHWKEVMLREKPKQPSKIFWKIVNLLSDHVQEKNCLGEYYGRDGILLHGREAFMKYMVMPDMKKDVGNKIAQMFLYDTNARSAWNSHLTTYDVHHDKIFFDKLDECGQWSAMRNEKDTFELAKEIFKLFEEEQEQEEQQADGGGGGGASGDDASDNFLPTLHKEVADGIDPNPMTFKDDGSRRHTKPSHRVVVRKPYPLSQLKKR